MITRWSSLCLALIVLPLILLGLFPCSPAATMQQAFTGPPGDTTPLTYAAPMIYYLPLVKMAPPPPPLLNGSFEGDWWRKTYLGREYDNIFVPEHWVAFWDGSKGRPEMQVINFEAPFIDPPRVYSGEKALKYFTFWRTGDAGVFQQVQVLPGYMYRARAYAHVWYSGLDNPYKSQWVDALGVHDIVNGDPGMEVMIGIDPTGGKNPWADAVVWSAANIYDRFDAVEVQAVAQSSLVTVYLRAVSLDPFKHCDAYWDEVTFELVK